MLRTLPAVSALRGVYPGAHIAWLVEARAAAAVEGQPWVDEVIVFPRAELRRGLLGARPVLLARHLRGFLRTLRSRRFELVLDFHAILRSGVLSLLSGAPLRVTYAPPHGRELSWLFANHRAQLSSEPVSRFERNEALIRFLSSKAECSHTPYRLDPPAVARMRRRLGSGPRPVAIHPGTSRATPHKRYTVGGYAAFARTLLERDGIPSIVTSGAAEEDRDFADAVSAASEGAAQLAPETPSLADLAALLSQCRLYVGGDTGPTHLAALVGTPVVQILGPTDPVENAPHPATPSRSLRVPPPCAPCRRGCPAASCMRAVPPEVVIAAARELLGVARPAGSCASAAG